MWQRSFYKSIHGYVRLHQSRTGLFVDLDNISQAADVNDALLDVWTRRVGRSV
jgi:hypothetical protein